MTSLTRAERADYGTLFFSTLKLSACTFGGGFVIIPLLRRRFVEELGWIDEQEMLNLTAIAQSSPGAIAVNASILIGYQVAGVPGALLTVLGTILPPLVIITIVSLFYQAFRDSAVASMAMAGMLCGVAAVVLDVAAGMLKSILRDKRPLHILILAGAFVALRLFSVNVIAIILACALIGAADTWRRDRMGRRRGQ
ncbi:MAG: chromate transporter [Clostridia bacterium]|nr:chromate transporter [Clostridia bacterium]